MATDNKYDRQIRLWGAQGQRALSTAHVCLLGAGPTGSETLKNLVLPGVGAFTVVDGARVSERDLANNFFVSRAHLGASRARAVVELLLEMNPDVRGSADERAPEALLAAPDGGAAFFAQFQLVVATQMAAPALRRLAAVLAGAGVPLIAARAVGLVGQVRLLKAEHRVVEARLTRVEAKPDLCTLRPFPALRALADATDLAALSSFDLAQVPCIVLIIKAVDAVRRSAARTIGKDGLAPDRLAQSLRRCDRSRTNKQNSRNYIYDIFHNRPPFLRIANCCAFSVDPDKSVDWPDRDRDAILAALHRSCDRNAADVPSAAHAEMIDRDGLAYPGATDLRVPRNGRLRRARPNARIAPAARTASR